MRLLSIAPVHMQEAASSSTNLRTMVLHASAILAQTRMDPLDSRLGPSVLAAIRTAEFLICLRHRKRPRRRGIVAGTPADIFNAGLRIAAVSNALHFRSCERPRYWPSHHWWNRIHVRPECAASDSPAQPVSYSDATAVTLGDLAARLRPAR